METSRTDEPGQGRRKNERLEARISQDQKTLFQRAAALQGRSLTDFIVNSAQDAARQTIRDHEILDLSVRDREIFVAALLEEAEPGKRLRAATRRYKERAR